MKWFFPVLMIMWLVIASCSEIPLKEEEESKTDESAEPQSTEEVLSGGAGDHYVPPEEILGQWNLRLSHDSVGDTLFQNWVVLDVRSSGEVHYYYYTVIMEWSDLYTDFLIDRDACVGVQSRIQEENVVENQYAVLKLTPASSGKLLVRMVDKETRHESTSEFVRGTVPTACIEGDTDL